MSHLQVQSLSLRFELTVERNSIKSANNSENLFTTVLFDSQSTPMWSKSCSKVSSFSLHSRRNSKNWLSGTVGWAGRLSSIPGRVVPEIWKTVVASYPTSWSALMDGWVVGTVHARCFQWLATSAAFTTKINASSPGPSKRKLTPQTTRDTRERRHSVKSKYRWNWVDGKVSQ